MRNIKLLPLLQTVKAMDGSDELRRKLVEYVACNRPALLVDFGEAYALKKPEPVEPPKPVTVEVRFHPELISGSFDKKIHVIKWFREQTGLGLKESKDWSEGILTIHPDLEKARKMVDSFTKTFSNDEKLAGCFSIR